MSEFSNKLKELRTSKNISQKQIASQLDIADRQYRRYENEEQQPTLPIIIKLANYFDISLDYLVGRTDNPNSHKS
ncbi:MAG: helix-turn-helix transcriptional regulator [Firmicutes bacterium]|jgi:transcriptional regulator with XRE-family HTH domain|nr:helix-turn-helix transcriptional regulator [Bacillota bacterium]